MLRVGFLQPSFAVSEDAGTSSTMACLSYSFENDPPPNLQGVIVNMRVQSVTFLGGAESKLCSFSGVQYCMYIYICIYYSVIVCVHVHLSLRKGMCVFLAHLPPEAKCIRILL